MTPNAASAKSAAPARFASSSAPTKPWLFLAGDSRLRAVYTRLGEQQPAGSAEKLPTFTRPCSPRATLALTQRSLRPEAEDINHPPAEGNVRMLRAEEGAG